MNPTPTAAPPAPDPDLAQFYADDAAWYVKQLPLEHFMESTAQATQRKITVAAFDGIATVRPDVQCFSELLIQYGRTPPEKPERVVPDNFVVVYPTPIAVEGSYPLDLVPARPLFVLEYVSKGNARKDTEDNMTRYEQALRVPYFLLFYPDADELTLFRLAGGQYRTVGENAAGRRAVPELELEVGLVDGWVRFWFRGALMPMTSELTRQLATERAALSVERAARAAAERERDAERAARQALEAELARLRAGA